MVAAPFDAGEIDRLGWRQGAVLGSGLAASVRQHAPPGIPAKVSDWLIVTSHDCDLLNGSLEKEPVVEVLRADVDRNKSNARAEGGRNPRLLALTIPEGGEQLVLSCRVHERWTFPRELLLTEGPARRLPPKLPRLVAEWLAKRYIRAAFPTAFDRRWRGQQNEWISLLKRHSAWIQGVYLRLNTLAELEDSRPYRCHFFLATPAKLRQDPSWPAKKNTMDDEVSRFWNQFSPMVVCDGVEVRATDELTLADIEVYQRFDADWISFADETPTVPPAADMAA